VSIRAVVALSTCLDLVDSYRSAFMSGSRFLYSAAPFLPQCNCNHCPDRLQLHARSKNTACGKPLWSYGARGHNVEVSCRNFK
jgi:hypothetical protein